MIKNINEQLKEINKTENSILFQCDGNLMYPVKIPQKLEVN